MQTTVTDGIRKRGAALITALGLLFLFSLMGAAYVDYMYIAMDHSRYDQRLQQARAMASGGVQAGIGEIQQATMSGRMDALLAGPREFRVPVYGPSRQDPKGFSPRTNRMGAVTVKVAEEKGPWAEVAAKGSAAPVRSYWIVSESRISDLGPGDREMRTTHARAEAVAVFGEGNSPRIVYWNEGP
ncbi:MAG TPA: hypothetical protein PKO36_04395 [Candidatus Hydrogenedentes bacterium]|nr:hypothetical protein [Candidatus Hydrogenedentota bacterium]HOT50613.1 hypothetical protein [Candidatus Hydrogenedentota bacterium]HOV74206.1 hypothetical protein [Candidatus Hydrogenedentota bacterium]HPC15748.1 hypothetical protein [Candidatus Hydrogenedentota bacterium]HRT19628.1 hypothetical protein [Candidatus Hydrogenedentota bacterium]